MSAPRPVTLAQHTIQLRNAMDYAQQLHERLLAAGAVWDGQDGYSFVHEHQLDELETIMGSLPPWTDR